MASKLQYLSLLCLTWISFISDAQTQRNISLGSSLTAERNSSWPSPSGDFAFGFQQIEKGGFLLAIWFDKVPDKTIVWSANGGNLAPEGSKVELTLDGRFELHDPSGKQIWMADFSNKGVDHAAILDTGNFVLAAQDSVLLWQSFDQPTDTILPTQILKQPGRLVSRYSETNYSNGRFQLRLQNNGNLLLYTTHYPLDFVNFAYWSTQVFGTGFALIFNQTRSIYLRRRNGTIIDTISTNAASTQDFYQRAIIENDGIFRHYIYPKRNTSSEERWPKAWSSVSTIPQNICVRIGGKTGSGACGFNSYCVHDNKKSCHCPLGYSFVDPNDVMRGCKEDFISQSCNEDIPESHLFDFFEMHNTNWPGIDYETFESVDEDWCRHACLEDCFCTAVVFEDRKCWKKTFPLTNGRKDPSEGAKSLIKYRKDNSTLKQGGSAGRKDEKNQFILGSVLLSSSAFLNLLFIVATFLLVKKLNRRKFRLVQTIPFIADMNLKSFRYEELNKATNGFKEEVGHGAFSTVYKGILNAEGGKLIAVKRLDKEASESDAEFKAEVHAIGRTNHRNLVQLLGWCNEGSHRLLVYEYMTNGSLASFLFADTKPNWYRRIRVALETARGLLYLHEECSSQIIHCDIKPQNILLDEVYTARISDFGLPKLLNVDQTRTTTAIRGTKGYVAQEWFRNMPITVKVDVYSYGILLLELICCRKSYEPEEEERKEVLADWAYDCFTDANLRELVKHDEDAMNNMKMVEKIVMIAIWCIQEDPSLRPTMKKVSQMLEGSIDVPVPPYPNSFMSSV